MCVKSQKGVLQGIYLITIAAVAGLIAGPCATMRVVCPIPVAPQKAMTKEHALYKSLWLVQSTPMSQYHRYYTRYIRKKKPWRYFYTECRYIKTSLDLASPVGNLCPPNYLI